MPPCEAMKQQGKGLDQHIVAGHQGGVVFHELEKDGPGRGMVAVVPIQQGEEGGGVHEAIHENASSR